jgi:two-component system LytT family sensor kinase
LAQLQTATTTGRLPLLEQITDVLVFEDLDASLDLLDQQRHLALEGGNGLMLANALYKIGFVHNQRYDYQRALAFYKKALGIFEQLGKNFPINELYIDMAAAYSNLDERAEANRYLDMARTFFARFPYQNMQGRVFCRQAYLEWREGQHEKAASSFMEGDKLLASFRWKNTKDVYFQTLIASGLGWLHHKGEDFAHSVELYRRAIELCQEHGISSRLSWHYLYLGNSLSANGQLEEAMQCYRTIIDGGLSDKSPYTRAGAFGNLGKIFLRKGNMKQALAMFDQAESIYAESKNLDDEYNFAELSRNIARLFEEIGDDDNARRFYDKAILHAQNYHDSDQLSILHRQLANLFARKGNFEMAYRHELQHGKARESAINKEKARAFSELQVRYEAEKKERTAETLRLQATELQLKALRAQMNPHFIFNCLNSIQKHISSKDDFSAEVYLSKFAKLIRAILENSEYDAISLEEEITFLKNYLELEKLRFKDEFSYEILVSDDIEEDIMGVPPMIVQPHIENAIIHGIRGVDNGRVLISFSLMDEHTILCTVDDNGIGRKHSAHQNHSMSKAHRSLGTLVTLQRLQLLGRSREGRSLMVDTIDKTDEAGNPLGTRVEISIPIQQLGKDKW